MKKIRIYIIGLTSMIIAFAACNDDFLDRAPKTAITGAGFFKTATDLEIYVNKLYDNVSVPFSAGTDDYESDNVTMSQVGGESWTMLRGTLSADNVGDGGWNKDKWSQLRGINFMFGNMQDVSGVEADIQHFVGIARFFRACFYVGMVHRYSDVPWINKALDSDDPDVFKVQDPRTLVVDSIMADFEYAVANIKSDLGNRTRVNKYAALAMLSRFSLYEGTFRKYHPELNLVSTAERFLQRAATAAEEIISSEQFEITGAGVSDLNYDMYGAPGYQTIFHSLDLSGNKEIIMWKDKSRDHAGVLSRVLDDNASLSRSLMESFLMKDGARFTAQPGYATKTYTEVFKNRDPRLAEVFAYPGFVSEWEGVYYAPPTMGGYGQLKFYPFSNDFVGGGGIHYAALPMFRYAEVLLNFAEAKAELGTLSQADLEKSVTQLRNRVEMPPLNMANANASADPVLEQQYPNVSGANKGVLLEIRRERRVELACEGLRLWDLHRWYAGSLFGQHQQGIYLPGLGAYDVTGDGIADVALLNNVGDEANYSPDLIFYYLHNEDGNPNQVYLENGTSGHLMMNTDKTLGKTFEEPKYYYRPLPTSQIVLNPKLEQPYGWK
ncbi:MAG: RagB/SusD family nutrient uptake outer membrane protein [Tannerella sp.]|jgi:hypothetical protein|nr:RagB/SusD family nutrient uptake outer membrane protein [Tannerella sp.]